MVLRVRPARSFLGRDVGALQVEPGHGRGNHRVRLDRPYQGPEPVGDRLESTRDECRQEPGDAVPATLIDNCPHLLDGQTG
jgi:hypothetical protein